MTSVAPPASGTAPRKIAYFRRGLFSYSNVRTGEQLRLRFPEFEIEEIDVVNGLLRRHPIVPIVNFFWVLVYYWKEILAGRQTFRTAFYRTPFIFRKIRELARDCVGGRVSEFAFSIQTQSLYDASTPEIPHFVYTDHTHLVNLQYPGFPREELFSDEWIALEREIYQNARHVFVMSEHVRDSLIESYGVPPDRASCVCAGSNVDPRPVPMMNDNYRNKTVLFVGIDWYRKGGPTLVKAFELVLEKIPDARLVIVGCEPPVDHPQIEIVGKVPREEVKKHMTQASIFCLPTRVEPFGIVAVEAFYHRLPVVATQIGALPDVVHQGESGLLVPPDDAPALSKALIDLLSDPEKCRSFGEHGFAIVAQHYSWDEVGRKLRAGIEAALPLQPAVS